MRAQARERNEVGLGDADAAEYLARIDVSWSPVWRREVGGRHLRWWETEIFDQGLPGEIGVRDNCRGARRGAPDHDGKHGPPQPRHLGSERDEVNIVNRHD